MSMTAKEVKALRMSLGLSQFAFAQKMGVTNVTVFNWENGGKISQQVSNHLKLIKEGK